MLVRTDWKEAFENIGIASGMLVVLEGNLNDPQQTVGQYNTFLDAFLDVLTNEGTIVYYMMHDYQNDPSQWDVDVPLDEYEAIKEQLAQSTNLSPTQDMLANTMLLRDDCIVKRHPAFSVLVIGKYARFITRKIPLHFPNGKLSPMKACVDLKGNVLILNELSLQSFSFAHVLMDKKAPVIVAGGVLIENGMARWQKYLDVQIAYQDMEKHYKNLVNTNYVKQIRLSSDRLSLYSLEESRQGSELCL
jgi:aminoglycoside 3-N-acetyltransferase